MKTKELKRLLEKNGWVQVRKRKKLFIYGKDNITVAVPQDKTDIPTGTLNSILKVTGLK